jgi:hypothetical protein
MAILVDMPLSEVEKVIARGSILSLRNALRGAPSPTDPYAISLQKKLDKELAEYRAKYGETP